MQLLKHAQTEILNLSIPVVTKRKFIESLDTIAKSLQKWQKEEHRLHVDVATEMIETHFDKNKDVYWLVVMLPSATSKILADVTSKYVSNNWPGKSVYLGGMDEATGQVHHGCLVSPSHEVDGLVAQEWTAHVAKVVGGNAGGKGSISLGSSDGVQEIDAGMKAAEDYVKGLGI